MKPTSEHVNRVVINVELSWYYTVCIIGHNYHGHYLHAGGLSVNNYVRENKAREVNVRE